MHLDRHIVKDRAGPERSQTPLELSGVVCPAQAEHQDARQIPGIEALEARPLTEVTAD